MAGFQPLSHILTLRSAGPGGSGRRSQTHVAGKPTRGHCGCCCTSNPRVAVTAPRGHNRDRGPGLCWPVTLCSHPRPLALRPGDDTAGLGLPAGTGSPGPAPTPSTWLMHKNILFPRFEINTLARIVTAVFKNKLSNTETNPFGICKSSRGWG